MKRTVCCLLAAAVAALASVAANEAPKGRLDVVSEPEGARVLVDGASRGVAPCSVFELAPGRHYVRLEAPSRVSVDDVVAISEANPYVRKSYSLPVEKGLVLVKTDPAGADVSCEGVSLGATPLLITSLASGRTHALTLKLNGYQTKKISVATDGRHPLVREEELARDSGIVDCSTEPAGATVVVNGVERGVTPIRLASVPKGLATVTFRLAGYVDETRELRLAPGESQTLAVKLKGRPARLKVVSTPEGAKVFVDDDYQGKTPVTVQSLAAGTHKIRISLAGHAEDARDVTLANGAEATEEFTLQSVLGRIEVATVPPGARILVDGKSMGTTRSAGGDASRSQILALEKIPAGEHSVTAHLDGYQDVSRSVTVKAKDTGKVFLRLARVFSPDTEVETIRGMHRGVLVEKDLLGNITLEVSPGVQQTFRKEDIRKVKALSK